MVHWNDAPIGPPAVHRSPCRISTAFGSGERRHAFALNARRLSRGWPREYASLRAQLVRASESIPTNIVEGCARTSQKEFAHFLQIAISSSTEAEYHLRLARDHGVLGPREWQLATTEVCDIRRMLSGLVKKVRTTALSRQPSRTADSGHTDSGTR